MIKKVNITTTLPVRTVSPILNGNTTYQNLRMTTGDIYRCICMRAFVEEVLATGATVSLNSSNYNRINGPVPTQIVNVNVAKKEKDVTEDIKIPPIEEETKSEEPIGDPSAEAVDMDIDTETDKNEEAVKDTEEVVETISTEADEEPTLTNETKTKTEEVSAVESKPKTNQQYSNKKKRN